jgi:carboxyl-terminal processing protease
MDLKSFKEMLKKICLVLFIAATLACKADPRVVATVDGSNNLKPDAQQSIVAKELVTLIESYHYKKTVLNDSLSSVVFDRYLKVLDANRTYFLQSDIKEFEQYRDKMDDDLRDGDLSSSFYIFNVYQKRYTEHLKHAVTQLASKFDFSTNETYTYDREKMPWFASATEANDLWRKRIKYELLNLNLTVTDEEKNKKTLKQRYDNLLSQLSKTNNQDVFQLIMNSFTEAVDPHTSYFVPNEAQKFNEDLSRTLEGIGASLQLENEVVKIASLIPGGPAFKSKLLNVNDKIIAVAQGKTGEFVDVIGWRLDITVTKIKGPKGTVVRLKIIPAGQELTSKPKIIELVRDKVILADQSARKLIKTVTENGKTYKVGIIQLPAFYADWKAQQSGDPNYKSTTRDVKLILDTLKQEGVDAVVMDLRSNGGGSLQEAISTTGLFIKTGPVVQVKDGRNKIEVDEDEDSSVAWDGPLGVLIDRFSASASEIFAGAIQDYGRGIILGTQTYGKGTVQQSIDMSRVISAASKALLSVQNNKSNQNISKTAPQFGQINLTMAKFYRVNGSSTQHKGVMPDIQFPMTFPAEKFGESSEPSALPWDTIERSKFQAVGNLTDINKQLAQLHDERLKTSMEFKYLKEDIDLFNKRDAETSVTLNMAKLKKEREEQETKNLQRENQLRVLRGLPVLKKGDPKPKTDVDFIQDESLKVMADFIPLAKK